MTRFFAISALVLGLFAGVAKAQDCMSGEIEDARAIGAELSTRLQIANFRGDLAYMDELAGELDTFLESCTGGDAGRLPLVCDYNCHIQLARRHLFMAADLPLLSTSGDISRTPALSPQGGQLEAEKGLAIVDRGLSYLARQQSASDAGADPQEARFRTFTRQLVALNALGIRLRMSVGDTWYQTMSEARVKALAFAVSDALDVIPGAPLAEQPNLHKAHTQYREAMWRLIEVLMDVPGEATYDDLRAELELLRGDLTERLESVERGHLFLGLDPVAFTTIPFEELQQELEETVRELAAVEATIEGMIKSWSATQSVQAARTRDEGRMVRGQEVNLLLHQIGKLEAEAADFANDVQQEITALDEERDSFGYRQQIRSLEIQLSQRLAEFENRQNQLSARRELDLLASDERSEAERRGELRWLMGFEMTRLNLDLQISSILSQVTEYQGRIQRNIDQMNQINLQRGILAEQIAIASTSIARANDEIVRVDIRAGEVHALRRAATRVDICAIENQLAFVGSEPDTPFLPQNGEQPCDLVTPPLTQSEYQDQLCGVNGEPGLRQELFNQQLQARAFLLRCVVGDVDFSDITALTPDARLVDSGLSLDEEIEAVDCGNFTQTEVDFAKDLYDAEVALMDRRTQDLADQRDQMVERLDFLTEWVRTFEITTSSLQAALTAAEATLAIMAAIPETTIALAGLASGTHTKIDVYKPAATAVGALRSALMSTIQIGGTVLSNEQERLRVEGQLASIRDAYAQIDLQRTVKAVALHNSHFQLAGRQAQGIAQYKELALQSSIGNLECERGELGIDEQVERLKAQHLRLLSSMELMARENDLLSFDRSNQERLIDRHTREISIFEIEQQKLDASTAALEDENTRVQSLIGDAESRMARIGDTRNTVTELADQSQQITIVLNDIRERQRAGMLALSEDELAFVEAQITGEQTATAEMVAGLEQNIDLVANRADLQQQILDLRDQTNAEVAERREEVLARVSVIDDPEESRALFVVSQEALSDLVRGVPDYLSAKRRHIEQANRLLHLLRQRYATILASTGQTPTLPTSYVRTSQTLGAMTDDIADARFFNERFLTISTARIVIPSDSGFVRRLALDGSVRFEITPFAGTTEAMRERGFFTLWNEKLSGAKNMTLVDMVLGVQYQCTDARWNRAHLTHLGSGVTFRPLAEGSLQVVPELVVGPRRDSPRALYNLINQQSRIDQIEAYWNTLHQLRNFPPQNGPDNDPQNALPFLGAPVLGSYQLRLGTSDCPFDGAVFNLYLTFASTP